MSDKRDCGADHWHFDTPGEPGIDGHVGSDLCVFYRHQFDTNCHGVVEVEWAFSPDDPDAIIVGVSLGEGMEDCEYCLAVRGHAQEPMQQVAVDTFRQLHQSVIEHSIDLMARPPVLDIEGEKEMTTVLQSLLAFLKGDK